MLKLLTALSRVGLSELAEFVGGRTGGAGAAAVDAEDGWYRPTHVHPLEDRRVLAVSIVPAVTSVTSTEGSSVLISAELQGGTSGQTYDVTFDWQDGSPSTAVNVVAAADGTAPVSAAHTYADDAVYSQGGGDPVSLVVVGESASATVDVTITNVAPTISLTGAATVNEGATYTLNLGAVTDPGSDTVTSYRVNWGDGTTTGFVSGHPTGESLTHVYADNGPRTITVDLVDEDGSHLAAGSVNLSVTNVSPTINLTGAATVNEGATYTLNLGAITDPGSDTVGSYQIHWGDGTSSAVITGSPANTTATHTYLDNGSRTITVDLIDEDGTHVGAGTLAITVLNVAPTIALTGAATVNEGATYTLNLGAITDPGSDTVGSYQIHWGDGTSSAVITGSPANTTATHTYLDNGSRTITVDLIDEDGTHVGAGTLAITVLNVAPTIALTGAATVNEGATYTLNLGAITDPGSDTVGSYQIHWGDGTSSAVITGSPANTTATHTYLDNGSRTITVDLIDEDGTHVGAGTLAITVLNVAPTIALTGAATVNEGATYTLNLGAITDPGSDTVGSYQIHWGDGTSSAVITGSPANTTATHTYLDNGSRTITVDLIDEDGTHVGAGTLAVSVLNVAPAIQTVLVDGAAVSVVTITNGDTITLDVTFFDPGLNDFTDGQTLVDAIDWGDGSALTDVTISAVGTAAAGTYSFTATHQYTLANPNVAETATIKLSIFDGSATTTASPVVVTIGVNTAPIVTISPAGSTTINEGGSVTLNVTFVDDGPGRNYDITIVWGDGSPDTTFDITRRGGATFSRSHTYADDGTYSAIVMVTDGAGLTGTDTETITVNNVPPTIALAGAATINEGSLFALSLGAITDPGADTVTSYQIHWGDGASTGVVAGHPTGQIADHTYADDGVYTITVDLTDEDGTHLAAGSRTLTVNNVAPTIAVTGNATVDEGTPFVLTLGAVTDPGADTVTSYIIDWGDLTPPETITGHPTGQTATHVYADNGTFTISVTLVDEDGTHAAAGSHLVTVNNVPPVIAPGSILLPAIDEGQSAALTFSFTDPGVGDTFVIRIDWGDGNGFVDVTTAGVLVSDGVGGHTFSVNSPAVYLQEGTYTVQFEVSDGVAGALAVGSAPLTVNDVAPAINPLSITLPDILEGQRASLSFSFFDPGLLDLHNVTIDWGDGAGPIDMTTAGILTPGRSGGYTFTVESPAPFIQDGLFTVQITVSDRAIPAAFDRALATLTVQDVAPTIITGAPVLTGINEGQTAQLNFDVVDPGLADVYTVEVDWGDGSVVQDVTSFGAAAVPGTRHFALTSPTPYLQDGVYNVRVTVRDTSPTAAAALPADLPLTVLNVAPQFVAMNVTPGTINEGDAVTLQVTFNDPGLLDFSTSVPVSVTIDWGDGTVQTVQPVNLTQVASGVYSFQVTRVFRDDGPSTASTDINTITLTFQDDHTAVINRLPATTVTVHNVPPLMTSALTPVLVDSVGIVTLNVTFSDRGVFDALSVVSVDWEGPGATLSAPQVRDMGNGVFVLTAQFQYVQDPPEPSPTDPNPVPHFTVQFTVTDKDGDRVSASIDANFPVGISRPQLDAPALAPSLALPQSIAQTVAAESPSSIVAAIQSEPPTSSQATVENTVAQVVLREVLPNGREIDLATFDENALDDVLNRLRLLPDRRYRLYMVMPDGSERLIVDVVVRQGQPTDPAADRREMLLDSERPVAPPLNTESESSSDLQNSADAPAPSKEVDAPVDGSESEGTDSRTDNIDAGLPFTDDEEWGELAEAGVGVASSAPWRENDPQAVIAGPRLP